jgi:hypothetical protein
MDQAELVLADLYRETMPLVHRIDVLTGGSLYADTVLLARLRGLARALADVNPSPEAASCVMAALFPYADPPLSWWSTSAGQAVAQAIGYHRSVCPAGQAAAILNVSRQRITQLVAEGRLVEVAWSRMAVAAPSVRDELLRYGRRGQGLVARSS